MFCPQCKCEFRPGFTHCASCDVDLVESLDAVPAAKPRAERESVPAALLPMVEYCGFLELDEARSARERLREHGIGADIVIRDSPDGLEKGRLEEEYWLRVDARRAREIAPILGVVPQQDEEPADGFRCGNCDTPVQKEEGFCPNCGTRFGEGG